MAKMNLITKLISIIKYLQLTASSCSYVYLFVYVHGLMLSSNYIIIQDIVDLFICDIGLVLHLSTLLVCMTDIRVYCSNSVGNCIYI